MISSHEGWVYVRDVSMGFIADRMESISGNIGRWESMLWGPSLTPYLFCPFTHCARTRGETSKRGCPRYSLLGYLVIPPWWILTSGNLHEIQIFLHLVPIPIGIYKYHYFSISPPFFSFWGTCQPTYLFLFSLGPLSKPFAPAHESIYWLETFLFNSKWVTSCETFQLVVSCTEHPYLRTRIALFFPSIRCS